jgi:hypothetical protein
MNEKQAQNIDDSIAGVVVECIAIPTPQVWDSIHATHSFNGILIRMNDFLNGKSALRYSCEMV